MLRRVTEPRGTPPILAALVSLALPGLGHAITGHARRGALWIGVMLAGITACVIAGTRTLWAIPVLGTLLAGVAVAMTVDAWLVARRGRGPGGGWVAWGIGAALLMLVAPIAAGLGLRRGTLESFAISSGSMCPTLLEGDLVFADKTAYRGQGPARGDVVVHADPTHPGKKFMHRVVAVAGDAVELRGHELRVGGQVVPTRALNAPGCAGASLLEEDLGPPHRIAHTADTLAHDVRAVVPDAHVYLLGDNRDNSYDSRFTGPIPVALVTGRAWRLWRRAGAWTWQPVN